MPDKRTRRYAAGGRGAKFPLLEDVPQVQNSELLGPATAMPLKRDSPEDILSQQVRRKGVICAQQSMSICTEFRQFGKKSNRLFPKDRILSCMESKLKI